LIIAIVGATGTGKSGLSLDLAERLAERGTPAEVVNADAMQLYRGMDIGTAKLSLSDRRGIPHHLLDVLEISDESSVADYQVQARAAIDDILGRGAIPILVGGSGLYVSRPAARASCTNDCPTSTPRRRPRSVRTMGAAWCAPLKLLSSLERSSAQDFPTTPSPGGR
jgi:tRNA dimethylallyltransferase